MPSCPRTGARDCIPQPVRRCRSMTISRRPSPFGELLDRKSTRLNSSHANISYAVFCLKKKKKLMYQPYIYTKSPLIYTKANVQPTINERHYQSLIPHSSVIVYSICSSHTYHRLRSSTT